MRTRDMSRAEFRAALERNGFRPELGGWWYKDTTGAAPGVSFGALFSAKGKLLRRSTIARLIDQRKRHTARKVS